MNKLFVIAEIGINHNGDIEIAKKLIDMAVRCGCDAVKFQKRDIEKCYTPEFLDQPRESPWGSTQRDQKWGLEFGLHEYNIIDTYCQEKGIDWFASAWDVDSQLFLLQYHLKYNKIASAMIGNEELLEVVAKEGKHTFISIGLNDQDKTDTAVGIFRQYDCPFTLMHCVMKYPCPLDKCKLLSIVKLQETYGCSVGYSCHNPGILGASIAVALGAEAIEKHITLDRAMYGSDQPASLEERGLELVVRDCRAVRAIL